MAPEDNGKSLGKKLKGIFSSKNGSSSQQAGQSSTGFSSSPRPQQGGSYRPVPGPYFAPQPPQQQWNAHPPAPSALAPNPYAPPAPNNPYAAPPRQQFPPPPLGGGPGQYGGAPIQRVHTPNFQLNGGPGRQCPLPPAQYGGLPLQRVHTPNSQAGFGAGQHSPLPPQQYGQPPLQRVHTPNADARPLQHGPPPSGSSFVVPSHGVAQRGGFLSPGPPIGRVPSPGIIRSHSPAVPFVGAAGPGAQQRPVIVVFPNSFDNDSDDEGVQAHRVGGPPGPSTRRLHEMIPVRTKDGIVFVERVVETVTEGRSSSPLPLGVLERRVIETEVIRYPDSERSTSPDLPPGVIERHVIERREIGYSDSERSISPDGLAERRVVQRRVIEYSDSERSSSPELRPQVGLRPGLQGLRVAQHEYDDYAPSRPATRNGSRSLAPPSAQPGEGEGRLAEMNFNRRYDYMPENMVPHWYIKDPEVAPVDAASYLCANCRHIDFISLFRQEESDVMPKSRDYISLGQLHVILANSKQCGFCRFVLRMVGSDGTADLVFETDEERLTARRENILTQLEEAFFVCPIRFKTTYGNPALYICSAKEVAEATAAAGQGVVAAVKRPRQSMAFRPLHISAGNLGRPLREPSTLDFDWVRERMALCDERDVGKQDFSHNVPVRAIDVEDMCIVDVESGTRYLTLSYTWGDITQPKLTRALEPQLRQPGGLWALLESVPLTIRDAMTLTRKIGERLLWVDALCIIQDDPADLKRSLGEMGEIYRNSVLTICACCGQDAAYGLPGVRPGTRKTEQLGSVVGGIVLGNILPASEAVETSKWSTRGWTMQEKVLSQRKLQITDHCALWWCWHSITSEDENCRHSGWQPGTRHQGMHFFRTEHDLAVSKILGRKSNMDTYAFVVSDYTNRDLTVQADAANALLGVFDQLGGTFRGDFIAGLPDTEMVAALLWVPIGAHRRRCGRSSETQEPRPLFPSWSWLGWIGQAAYTWLVERSIPMSESGSPLLWRNHDEDSADDDIWFTGTEYRLNGATDPNAFERQRGEPPKWRVNPVDGWTSVEDGLDKHARWMHPVKVTYRRRYAFVRPGSDGGIPKLRFRTLSAFFRLEGTIRRRKENYDHLCKVYQMRVLDKRGYCAGYIYLPDLENMASDEAGRFDFKDGRSREFVVLSRASTNPDPRVGKDLLHTTPIEELSTVYSSMGYGAGWMQSSAPTPGTAGESGSGEDAHLDEVAHFDTRVFDGTTPWSLFNVMLIERKGRDGLASRVTIGRIHVAAFMDAEPWEKEIVLE
ncbi:heterokaryon incompatibility protein-domain-containing protein [Cercophora newfieldiana]|uniref:Heterokaryon incompatibility protein-domain-containing protein n=1 Tax=Cercophora newfieldiana TaxID=92897 RepID=A0AA39Y6D6_9PEZI|nr:heterokaryon incompatibility protein-domain-containing protein [Cercophora newfieldiana]